MVSCAHLHLFSLQTKWFGLHFLCGLAGRVRVSFHHADGRRVASPSCANLLRRGVRILFGRFPPARDVERPAARDHRGYWEAEEKTQLLASKSQWIVLDSHGFGNTDASARAPSSYPVSVGVSL